MPKQVAKNGDSKGYAPSLLDASARGHIRTIRVLRLPRQGSMDMCKGPSHNDLTWQSQNETGYQPSAIRFQPEEALRAESCLERISRIQGRAWPADA